MKKIYIVDKISNGKVNTTIKAVELIENDTERQRYIDKDGKEQYVQPFSEYAFESESFAQMKIVELIQFAQDEERAKIIKKHEQELKIFNKKQDAEKDTLLQSIKIK